MPQTEVFFFRDAGDDSVPLLEWLDQLPTKVQAKCTARIDRLGEMGNELRPPGRLPLDRFDAEQRAGDDFKPQFPRLLRAGRKARLGAKEEKLPHSPSNRRRIDG
mgnify:CR=1 FL=1